MRAFLHLIGRLFYYVGLHSEYFLLNFGRGARAAVLALWHGVCWMLALGARPAGAVVRALAWIGPAHAGPSLASLRRTLPRAEWQALAAARATLPGWMAQAIGEETARV